MDLAVDDILTLLSSWVMGHGGCIGPNLFFKFNFIWISLYLVGFIVMLLASRSSSLLLVLFCSMLILIKSSNGAWLRAEQTRGPETRDWSENG